MRRLGGKQPGFPFDPKWDGDRLSTFDARKGALVFAVLFIFLLSFAVSARKARREAILEDWEVLGQQYIAEEEYFNAIIVFERLLEVYPQSALGDDALCRVGLCWLRLDKTDRAMEAWERFLKLYPNSKYAPGVRQSYLILMKDSRLRGPSV